ncbi:transposase family protein [Micromonospora sp. NPDC047134]|uniref:transposase family protein n=1 Tax=Micromonospora sp. NPDC047134 TaxID=3154340 RepID=UPI0033F99847
MVDVPRELVQYLARLLYAQRRVCGTRRGTRALTCFYQALMVLVWFRKAEDMTLLAAGFGISRATAYRYRDQGITVLAAQAEDLHTALRRAAADGWSHVILDGKLFDCDRLTETALSAKGDQIDAWYSGKHRDHGANIQAVIRPDGLPIWTSPAMPGHLHDTTCARELGITAALNWSAAELDLPTLADSGYESTSHGIKTRSSNPPTDTNSHPTTAPTTDSYAAYAGKENPASPSSSDAGKHHATPPSAHDESATSSPPRYTSPTSNTNTYRKVAEIEASGLSGEFVYRPAGDLRAGPEQRAGQRVRPLRQALP